MSSWRKIIVLRKTWKNWQNAEYMTTKISYVIHLKDALSLISSLYPTWLRCLCALSSWVPNRLSNPVVIILSENPVFEVIELKINTGNKWGFYLNNPNPPLNSLEIMKNFMAKTLWDTHHLVWRYWLVILLKCHKLTLYTLSPPETFKLEI